MQDKQCKGDCLECSPQQRAYCSAQMSRNAIDILERIDKKMQTIEERLSNLEEDGNASVFNPMQEDNKEPEPTEEAQ